MSLRKGSRYEGLKLYIYKDENDKVRKALDFRPPITLQAIGDQSKTHIYRDKGDWLDILAIQNGATREELWYLIADINAVEEPVNLVGGAVLFIPPPNVFLRF